MAGAIEVSDSLSNTEEQIERAAKIVGKGDRRRVFDAIYYHKAKVKTVDEIARRTRLDRLRVLQEGRHLVARSLVRQVKRDGEIAYEKIDFFHAHKRQILNLAGNSQKIAQLPTKRKVAVVLPATVRIPSAWATVKRVTVDDIDSFSRVRRVRVPPDSELALSESAFKKGIQSIIGERGKFKDWGGEQSDLFTTRVRFKGKRVAAAFAFKGPGEKGKLFVGNMGKRGDQAPRLFQEDADVFIVQHWREIDPSVIDLLSKLAVAKSVTTGNRIHYGVIDGDDSKRLVAAYPGAFNGRKD